jgi:hypothetical protein
MSRPSSNEISQATHFANSKIESFNEPIDDILNDSKIGFHLLILVGILFDGDALVQQSKKFQEIQRHELFLTNS